MNKTINEQLRVNPQCLVVSSMERRVADGIDRFLDEIRKMDHVGGVEINGTTGDGGICKARRDCEHWRSGCDKCDTTAMKTEETTINRLFLHALSQKRGG